MYSKAYLKIVKSLNKKKYRYQHSLFLVEGIRGCEELIKSDFHVDHIFYSAPGSSDIRIKNLLDIIGSNNINSYEISPEEMDDIADAVTSQSIIAVAQLPSEPIDINLSKMSKVLCLESISDPGNLGTIVRTASWFGVDAIILSSGSVDIYNPKVVRSSSGGIFNVPILNNVTLIDFLREAKIAGFEIIATVPHGGQSLHKVLFAEKSLLIFGSEADGISAPIISAADTLLSIPSKGTAESLNLAISCGIILGVMDFNSQA